ncbi:MAG: hypothetical protein KAX38_04145, partial [Candidatus Krumholzibacteria bacterium]|nr:hypothetical protein [Candidatus Krumholzibacteria bacterium]
MNEERTNIIKIFCLWSAVFVLTRIFFLHSPYHGEPDMDLMSSGIYYNVLSGKGLSGDFLYGKSFSYGYYFIVFKALAAFPALMRNLEGFLYLITFVSSLLTIFFVIKLFSGLKRSKLNLNIFLALWILSPVWWECTTYSHPIVPAIAALLAGSLALKKGFGITGRSKASIYFALSALLFFVSFSLRSEVMLLVPGVFLLSAEFRDRGRIVSSIASILIAVVIFFVVQAHLIPAGEAAANGLADRAAPISLSLITNFLGKFASAG